jgi:hypothetical protein
MENQVTDELLLEFLDGTLDPRRSQEIAAQAKKSVVLTRRLEELHALNTALKSGGRLEIPSMNFTQRVMKEINTPLSIRGLSPRNGILLFCGVLVAMAVALMLLKSGTFDQSNGTIALDKLPLQKDYLKNNLPALPFNGKWVVNSLLILATGISLVLLDRTILRPLFQRRSGVSF